MLPRVSWPPHVWVWSAGILMCLLGASGIAVVVRSASPAYAGSPASEPADGDAASAIPQTPLRVASAGPSRATCAECGTIASIREIESAAAIARREQSEARRDHGVAAATHSTATSNAEGAMYEVTIRFRDGRTSVFTEPGPPTWRVGNRIVFIAGATPKGN